MDLDLNSSIESESEFQEYGVFTILNDRRGSTASHGSRTLSDSKPGSLHGDGSPRLLLGSSPRFLASPNLFEPPADYDDLPMVDQDDIIALTRHVRDFSDALNNLRNTFISEGRSLFILHLELECK